MVFGPPRGFDRDLGRKREIFTFCVAHSNDGNEKLSSSAVAQHFQSPAITVNGERVSLDRLYFVTTQRFSS